MNEKTNKLMKIVAKFSVSFGPFPISYNNAYVLVTKNSTELWAGNNKVFPSYKRKSQRSALVLYLCLNENCRTQVNVNNAHRAENVAERNHIMVMFSC